MTDLHPITTEVRPFSPDLRAYIARAPIPCGRCGELAKWTDRRKAEPDCNMPAVEAGWYCGCGWSETRGVDEDFEHHVAKGD